MPITGYANINKQVYSLNRKQIRQIARHLDGLVVSSDFDTAYEMPSYKMNNSKLKEILDE